MELGPRDVGVLGQPVAAAGSRLHRTARIDADVLEERRTECLGDTTLDLAAALHRVHHLARVGGVHAAQDADLPGAGVHGRPEPLGVEGDRARGAAEVAVGGEVHPDCAAGRVQLLQR